MTITIIDDRPGRGSPRVRVALPAVPQKGDQVVLDGTTLTVQFVCWEIDSAVPPTHYAGGPTVYLR